VIQSLCLSERDTFVDLGSGKGRVACIAALWHLQEVIGVDDDPDMCAIARRNAERMKGRISPIRIEQIPAQNFDYTRGTVFYMFNPFGPGTLSVILQRLREGVTACPRTIRIVYATPAHEELLQQSGWLAQYNRWSSSTHHFVDDVISFWTNNT
jgi:predicted RNA methylase